MHAHARRIFTRRLFIALDDAAKPRKFIFDRPAADGRGPLLTPAHICTGECLCSSLPTRTMHMLARIPGLGEVWAAVMDGSNEWITVGTTSPGVTYKEKFPAKAEIGPAWGLAARSWHRSTRWPHARALSPPMHALAMRVPRVRTGCCSTWCCRRVCFAWRAWQCADPSSWPNTRECK